MNRASLLLFASITLAACIFDTSISLAGFDTSCVQDQDCVAVQEGDICGCDCGNAAINRKDLASYASELDDKRAHCTTTAECDCAAVTTACAQGRCTIEAP